MFGLGRLQTGLLTALAVVLVLVGAYAEGGRRARQAARLEAERGRAAADNAAVAERHRSLEVRDEVERDVRTGGGAAERLRNEWSRD